MTPPALCVGDLSLFFAFVLRSTERCCTECVRWEVGAWVVGMVGTYPTSNRRAANLSGCEHSRT